MSSTPGNIPPSPAPRPDWTALAMLALVAVGVGALLHAAPRIAGLWMDDTAYLVTGRALAATATA